MIGLKTQMSYFVTQPCFFFLQVGEVRGCGEVNEGGGGFGINIHCGTEVGICTKNGGILGRIGLSFTEF